MSLVAEQYYKQLLPADICTQAGSVSFGGVRQRALLSSRGHAQMDDGAHLSYGLRLSRQPKRSESTPLSQHGWLISYSESAS